jgi:hypothetical protein
MPSRSTETRIQIPSGDQYFKELPCSCLLAAELSVHPSPLSRQLFIRISAKLTNGNDIYECPSPGSIKMLQIDHQVVLNCVPGKLHCSFPKHGVPSCRKCQILLSGQFVSSTLPRMLLAIGKYDLILLAKQAQIIHLEHLLIHSLSSSSFCHHWLQNLWSNLPFGYNTMFPWFS